MKKYILPLLLLWCLHSWANTLYPVKSGDGHLTISTANPGDTIAITAAQNPFTYISMKGKNGTGWGPGKQITIMNSGGQVILTTGFDLDSNQYFKLTGSGSADWYGFYVNNVNGTVCISIHNKTKHIKVERIRVRGAIQAALACKNEVSCDTTLNYPNWRISDVDIGWIHATHSGGDNMYIGSTAPTGGRSINCPTGCIVGVNCTLETTYIPSRLGSVSLHDCYIDTAWRQGFQVSGSDSGLNYFYNDTAKQTGVEHITSQGVGIYVGGMTSNVTLYNNYVDSTFLQNYVLSGVNLEYFHNNFGGHPGRIYDTSTNDYATNVLIKDPVSFPVTTSTFDVEDNILQNVGTLGNANVFVDKNSNTFTAANKVCNSGTLSNVEGVTINTSCGTVPCTSGTSPIDNTTLSTSTTATLTWAASAGATSYALYLWLTGAAIPSSPTTTTSATTYAASGLTANKKYTWYVIPSNGTPATGCLVDTIHFLTANPPTCTAPTTLTTTNITKTAAVLNWSSSASAVTYQLQYRRAGTTTWTTLLSATTNLSYTLTGLHTLTNYNWRVRSNCTNGSSGYASKSFITK